MSRARSFARGALALLTASALAVSGTVLGPAPAAEPGELEQVGGIVLPETTSGVLDLAVSPDGTRAVAGGGEWLQGLALTDGDPKALGLSTTIFGMEVEISRDGRTAYVLSGGDTLFVVDISGTGKPRVVRQLFRRKFSPSHAFGIEISRNGRFLYVKHGYVLGGYGSGKGIQVLSLAKPRKPRKVGHTDAPEWNGGIAVSRDGKHLVTSNQTVDNYLLQYRVNPRTGKPTRVKRLRLPFSGNAVAIDEQNRSAYVLSGMSESTSLHLARLDLRKRRVVDRAQLAGQEQGLALAVSSDGRILYGTSWRTFPEDEQSFFTADARSLEGLFGIKGPGFYAPHAVAVSRSGDTKGHIYVPTYTGIMGGNPMLVVFRHP